MPLSEMPPHAPWDLPFKGSLFEADLFKKKIKSPFFPRTFKGYTDPTKIFLMSSEDKNDQLSFVVLIIFSPLLPVLSPLTLEILMHAITKWRARQWRLICSNKKYKKARIIQAKRHNRATTSFVQGSSSSFDRWCYRVSHFFKHTFLRNAN